MFFKFLQGFFPFVYCLSATLIKPGFVEFFGNCRGFGYAYHGHYKVLKKVNDLDYIDEIPDRRKPSQLCHINMLKTYHSRDNNTVGVGICKAHGHTSMTDRVACDKSLIEEDVLSDDTAACQDTSGMEDVGNLETPFKIRLSN